MKYNVTICENAERILELERALKHCRVNFETKSVEVYDHPGRMPEWQGFEIHFVTKSRKLLKYLGFTGQAIANFKVYRKRYKKYYCHHNNLPF